MPRMPAWLQVFLDVVYNHFGPEGTYIMQRLRLAFLHR